MRGAPPPSDEGVVVAQNWDGLRRFMRNYVDIVRSDSACAAPPVAWRC